jgi:hypothetical protein
MTGRWTVVGMLLLCACAGTQQPAPQGTAQAQSEEEPLEKPPFMGSCELYAEAPVTLSFENATAGAAIIYQTTGNVARLRERTQEVAKFHNGTLGKTRYLHDLRMIEHSATVEDVEGGAKLTLLVDRVRPGAQDSLRNHVQQEVTNMQKLGCEASHEAL